MVRKLLLISLMLLSGIVLCAQENCTTRKISFESGKYRLQGKLVLPGGEGKHPALVFLVGCGGKASYRTSYARFVMENLEQTLLEKGLALLYYDKRGIGKSEGNWTTTDLYQRAEDAVAAIRFLKNQPEIDSTRVGVVGHCHGGWVAQIVAARYPLDVAFGASLAGATVSVREELLERYQTEALCRGESPKKARERAEKKVKRLYATLSLFSFGNLRQLYLIRDFRPDEELRRIRCPFLMLFAENDEFVYPGMNLQRLHEIFSEGVSPNFEVETIKGVNHEFLLAPRCYSGALWELSYSSEFQEVLTNWILRQMK